MDLQAIAHIRNPDFIQRPWIIEKLKHWLEQEQSRMFLLTGSPGSGKTALAADLVFRGSEKTRSEPDSFPGAYLIHIHFCTPESLEARDPNAFLNNFSQSLNIRFVNYSDLLVADQITIRQSNQRPASSNIRGIYIENFTNRSLYESLFNMIQSPLEKIFTEDMQGTALVLVDAIENALGFGPGNIAELLAEMSSLPAQVRFVLTARNDQRIFRLLGNPSLNLDDYPRECDLDIHQYCERRLDRLLDALPAEISEKIIQNSQGNFLVCKYLLDEYEHGSMATRSEPPAFPGRIAQVYTQLLSNMDIDHSEWESMATIIGVIGVSHPPGLTLDQIVGITNMERQTIFDGIYRIGQLLKGSLPNGPFEVFHPSFADFLFDRDINEDYYIHRADIESKFIQYFQSSK